MKKPHWFVLIMVTCLGTLMFMVENGQPDTQFTDLATSVYWAIVTMTTVGYGDITPVTPIAGLYHHCRTHRYRYGKHY